ncbi:MAG TPA: metal-dependent hydrolase [Polyangiaceae bacterium]|nr:metal-dependent hydrolase [Polyangiaceae bacterium]
MAESNIRVRVPSFEIERSVGGLWNPNLPELSHTLNAFQLALPYLEPYFIDAIRRGAEQLEDGRLKADALAFCAQEANHSRQHKRYCMLLRKRYPELERFEYDIQQSLVTSRQKDPLEWRLAYTAGYEQITAELARVLFKKQKAWLDGADEHFAAMMLWHAAEELEHRHVAFDVLSAVTKDYRLRARGLVAAMRKTYADMAQVVTYMLEVDGYAGRLDSRLRRAKVRLEVGTELVPTLVRYLTPGYHPSKDRDPPGLAEWHRSYQSGGTTAKVADDPVH